MGKNHISDLLCVCKDLREELETINTIIIMTQTYYINKEFTGQYYSLPREFSVHISEERNRCINILSLLSDKTNKIKRFCEDIEDGLELHNDSDDCC